MILVLLAMLFIGPTQVIWAIIHAIVTRQPSVRKHFGFYGLGVVAYFLVILILSMINLVDFEYPLFDLHFFGGAFVLFAYHIWIVAHAATLRRQAEYQPQEWV